MTLDVRTIIWGTIFILLFGLFSYSIFSKSIAEPEETAINGSWACSADYAICPDGSEVYRTPPYCQFAPCLK